MMVKNVRAIWTIVLLLMSRFYEEVHGNAVVDNTVGVKKWITKLEHIKESKMVRNKHSISSEESATNALSSTGAASDTGADQGIKQTDVFSSHNYTFRHAVVAADHYKCSIIGKNILKKGGSAIDAAIATHLCVEVVNSHSTGLGGGGFLVYYNKKKGQSYSIDFRESLSMNFVQNKNMTQGDTILVPGVLRGLEEAHRRSGKLPWTTLFEEAIDLAENGFIVHEALAIAIAKKKDYILTNLGLKETYAPGGWLLKKGQVLKRPKLAETYRKIAKSGGADIFYKGEIAVGIVQEITEAGGSITLDDLKNYQAVVRPVLTTNVSGLKLMGAPPPSSSVVVAMMLKIMEKFKWKRHMLKNNLGLFYHQMVEAMKFAFAPFTFLGDPRYQNDTQNTVDYMLNDTVIENIFKKINNESHLVDYYGPYSKKVDNFTGTSHISILGPDGDACSITSSINAYFGSKLMSRKFGFLYNNELSDFGEFWPRLYHYKEDSKIPGKRPLSRVSPLIFTDHSGNVKIVAGAAGGFFIPTALASTLANHLFLKDNITMAVARPRIHCQLFPPTVVYEESFPPTIVPLLNQYHHKYVTTDSYSVSGQPHAIMGVVQAISQNTKGEYEAVCDYRKGGLPSGF